MTKAWLPLEANAHLLTEYGKVIGLPAGLGFHEVISMEPWALEMIPTPVEAVLLVFPISEDPPEDDFAESGIDTAIESCYFMEQTVGNACGTIALLHALINLSLSGKYTFEPSSYVSRILESTKHLTARLRADWLATDPEIEALHARFQVLGDTPVEGSEDVDTHFICFIRCNDHIVELDGRRGHALTRAYTEEGNGFPEKVFDIIRTEFVDRNPGELRFSILALAPTITD
jgi:ubiquitin carboxyl-terminal hydrolase L3